MMHEIEVDRRLPTVRVEESALKDVPVNLNCPLITELGELRSLCDRLARAELFAFDTEFIMEDSFDPQVCLIQVATEKEAALIDPLANLDTTCFWELVADPSVKVLVHAGMEDLALCLQIIGKPPANIFDIQIAAGLVTHDYPIGLARLVQSTLKVRLHKSQTLTNWRNRPLTDAQKRYGVDDVAYIPAIHKILMRKLERRGRVAWADEEAARFDKVETYKLPKQSRVSRLKGTGSLNGKQLACVLELLEERDELARKFNRPARVVLRDHLLVEIGRHGLTKEDQVKSLRGLSLRPSAIKDLTVAVQRGLDCPPEKYPEVATSIEDTPEELVLTALLTAVLRDACRREKVAFSLTATKQTIRALLHSHTRGLPAESPLQKGWRAEMTGQMLDDLLTGKAAVNVVGKRTKMHLAITPGDATQPE